MRHNLVSPTLEFLRAVVVIWIVLLVMAPAARAVDFEWDGGGGADNRWSNAANWNQVVPPDALDNIILTGASAAGPVTIDVDGAQTINRIQHSGANGDYTFGETVGADTITIFQLSPASVLVSQTQGSDLTFNSNILLNQGGGSVLRFNSTNAADNSGHIVVNGNVSPSAAATGAIQLSITSTNKSPGPWVTVNGVISDGPGPDPPATIGLTAGVETTNSTAVIADHAGEVAVTGLNTFTGPVVVSGGKLIFNSIQNAGSTTPNALGTPALADSRITLGASQVSSATLRYVGSSTASNTSDRDIIISGFDVSGTIEASGSVPLILNGTIQTATSATTRTLNLAGSNTLNNTLSGEIETGAGTGVLNVNKNGSGKWILSGNSSALDGSTTVNAGELVLTGAIGSTSFTAGRLMIAGGGTFTLDGGDLYVIDLDNSGGVFNFKSGLVRLAQSTTAGGAGSLTVGTDGVGILQLNGGSQVFGNVNLQGTDDSLSINAGGTYEFTNLNNSVGGTVGAGAGQNVQINGGLFTHRVDAGTTGFLARIQGTGGFTKQGAGTLVFSGTNAHTYTGNTRIEGGTLRVTTSDLPTVPTFIAAGATLDLENAVAGDEVGRLTGAGTVINTEFATFAVNFTGADGNFAGSITGPGSFAKRGTGKQILSGASNYTGATIVDGSGGTLEIAPGGSITGTSDVTYSTNATLSVAGGTIDTTARIRPIANSAVLNITAGLVKANQIDRSTSSQYLDTFTWTGGTVHLLSATRIGGPLPVADRPFNNSLTLTAAKTLIVDSSLSVLGGGTLTLDGGTVIADTIATGGTIDFNSGTMRMRNNQTFDAARLTALDLDTPFNAARTLIVDGSVTVNAPFTLAGGSFSAGQLINPQNLILSSGTLNVTNSDLAISAGTAVDTSTGMTVNVISGGLNNAGQFNAVGTVAEFATASTNDAGAQINAINSMLSFDGGLTNDGELNLINSTVSGAVVNSGTSAVAGAATFLGDVSGAGNFTGGGEVVFQGSYAPGASPADVAFEGSIALADTNTLFIEIAGTTPGSQYDRLTIAGDAALDGILDVSLAGFSPAIGQQFTVLTAGSITDNGLALGGPAASSFNLLVDTTSVILQAIAAGLPGDFNTDGKVDAADYIVWRKNDGSQEGYNTWRANFGRTIASGATAGASNGAVPEPASFLLLLAAAVVPFRRRS